MSLNTLSTLANVIERNYDKLPSALTSAMAEPAKSGTMRGWFESKHGQAVSTIQISESGGWAPMARTVDASRATYVTLDGSRRDYAAMVVIHADSDVLIVDGKRETIAYF